MTYYTILDSPIGPLLLTSDGVHITRLFMCDHVGGPTAISGFTKNPVTPSFSGLPLGNWQEDQSLAIISRAKRQIEEYFGGSRYHFELPLEPEGSEFQKRVWMELTRIPFGQTISYGELARRIGKPDASRAVGLANGKNPIAVIVPCHRVIGANGKLTGYGGGLDRKVWLLEHEATGAGKRQPELTLA